MTTATENVLNLSGFNGAFVHPNAHTTYASLLVIFLAIVWILSRYRHTWLTVPVMACWFAFMGWSGSRTSFISTFAGIFVLVAYAKPFLNRRGWRIVPNVKRSTLVAGGVAAAAALMVADITTGGSISRQLVSFINKNSAVDAALDTETILASRKGLIDYSWRNFEESPVFGIGFGVAKTEMFVRNATLFTAPVEKGFLPTAILEEGGVLGTVTFVLFLLTLLRELHRERNVAGLVTFVAFLATNLGEVTIFAPGGGGSFGWTMVGAGMLLGDQCWSPVRAAAIQRSSQL